MPATAIHVKGYTKQRQVRRAAWATGVTRTALAWGFLLVQGCHGSDAVAPEGGDILFHAQLLTRVITACQYYPGNYPIA